MKRTIFIWLLAFPCTVVFGQSLPQSRLQVSVAVGALSTASSETNLFGESIGRLDRTLQLTEATVAYRKSERLLLAAQYYHGQTPDTYLLAGLHGVQSAYFIGGTAQAGAYANTFRYGAQTYSDSLKQDVLWIDQSYEFATGYTPRLGFWAGIGINNQLEWMATGSIEIPVAQQMMIEPMVVFSKTALSGLDDTRYTRLGLRAHFGLFEKGQLSAGVTQQVSSKQSADGWAFAFTGTFPLMKHHALNLSVQQHASDLDRTTVFAFGGSLGIGRLN